MATHLKIHPFEHTYIDNKLDNIDNTLIIAGNDFCIYRNKELELLFFN